jgi:hypothetical protein
MKDDASLFWVCRWKTKIRMYFSYLLEVRGAVTIQSEHSTRYYSGFYSYITPYLQRVLEELVHLGDLGRDGKVDGTVADLNNETTTDLRVDLRAQR